MKYDEVEIIYAAAEMSISIGHTPHDFSQAAVMDIAVIEVEDRLVTARS